MKKIITSLSVFMCLFVSSNIMAQTPDTLAFWHFEDQAKRTLINDSASFIDSPYTADEGTVANKNIAPIKLYGGNKFANWVSGLSSASAPNSNGWQDGDNSKYWQVSFSTLGYDNISLSSNHYGSNTGPKDFKVQYSVDGIIWNDVPNGSFTVAGNWTSGVIQSLALPAACNNVPLLHVRWIMTSNIAINNNAVASTGTNRLDNILFTGQAGVFGNDATLNPNNFIFNIDQPQSLSSTITWNDASNITFVTNLNTPLDTLTNSTDYQIIADTITILQPYLANQFTFAGQIHHIVVHFDVGNPATITVTWDDDSIYSAQIMPDSAYFDLLVPANVSTNIQWNDATALVGITDDQPTPYTLQAADYSLSGNTLTINETYLSGVFTQAGQTLHLTLDFDAGDSVIFVVKSMVSPPAPTVIAHWDFEDAVKRATITDNASFVANPYTADNGIVGNIDMSPVSLVGGSTFSGWVTGAVSGFAPNAVNWNDGENSKYWMIEVSTMGYGSIELSSKQRSSSGGPANFIAQYSIDNVNWVNIPGSTIVCAENFTSGVLDNLPLPAICNDRTQLYIRWVMSSNTSVGGSIVTSTGTNRIDDIIVKGQYIIDEADIVEFSFPQQTSPAQIDYTAQTIDIEVHYGTDRTQLVADFILSPNATASVSGTPQASGITINDFSAPLTYDITAGNGTTQKAWTVHVTEAAPSSESNILAFTFVGQTVLGTVIDSANATVDITLFNANTTNLIADFVLSPGAFAHIGTIPQVSGVTANDFSNTLVYRITAQDSVSYRDWNVYVSSVVNNVEQDDLKEVQLYPNPAKNTIFINVKKHGYIEIVNLAGKVVFTQQIAPGINTINIEEISSGLYIVKMTSEDKFFTRKLIIQ
jgi:hypothetical protein